MLESLGERCAKLSVPYATDAADSALAAIRGQAGALVASEVRPTA
jgi:hypothetical protein